MTLNLHPQNYTFEEYFSIVTQQYHRQPTNTEKFQSGTLSSEILIKSNWPAIASYQVMEYLLVLFPAMNWLDMTSYFNS